MIQSLTAVIIVCLALLSNQWTTAELVRQPLPATQNGCPIMQYWGAACHGIYNGFTEFVWRSDDLAKKVVHDGYYKCCSWANGASCNTDQIDDAGAEEGRKRATCIYSDNYCPELKVIEADSAVCVGEYVQKDDLTWTRGDKTLTLVGRYPDGLLKLECKEGSISQGYVRKYECKTPYEPLVYGMNVLHDGSHLFVPNPDKIGPRVARSYQIEMPDDLTEWVKVWVMDQSYYRPYSFMTVLGDDPRPAHPVYRDYNDATYHVKLQTDGRPHTKERINVLSVIRGHYTTEDGQTMAIGEYYSKPYGHTLAVATYPYGLRFPSEPVLMAQLFHTDKGLLGYRQVRVVDRRLHEAVLAFESLSPLGRAYNQWVGMLVIHTGGKRTGLFGNDLHYQAIGEGDTARTPYLSVATDATSLVFAEAYSEDNGQIRVFQDSADRAALRFVRPSDEHPGCERYVGGLVLFNPHRSTTTTTTTPTTTTTTTTTVTSTTTTTTTITTTTTVTTTTTTTVTTTTTITTTTTATSTTTTTTTATSTTTTTTTTVTSTTTTTTSVTTTIATTTTKSTTTTSSGTTMFDVPPKKTAAIIGASVGAAALLAIGGGAAATYYRSQQGGDEDSHDNSSESEVAVADEAFI